MATHDPSMDRTATIVSEAFHGSCGARVQLLKFEVTGNIVEFTYQKEGASKPHCIGVNLARQRAGETIEDAARSAGLCAKGI